LAQLQVTCKGRAGILVKLQWTSGRVVALFLATAAQSMNPNKRVENAGTAWLNVSLLENDAVYHLLGACGCEIYRYRGGNKSILQGLQLRPAIADRPSRAVGLIAEKLREELQHCTSPETGLDVV
jgi:hypothetical protein